MRRFVIAALAGIALLGIGAVALILSQGDSPPAGAGTPFAIPDGGPPPAIGSPFLPTQPGLPLGLAAAGQVPPVSLHEAPPPPPDPDSWEAVAPVGRLGALRGIGGAIGRELNELQPRLADCFTEESQAQHGQVAFSRVQDAQLPDESGTTLLMLQLETRAGQVVIVDAPLETRGGASDGLIACAQRVLRGVVIPEPAAKSGARYRVRFPLIQ